MSRSRRGPIRNPDAAICIGHRSLLGSPAKPRSSLRVTSAYRISQPKTSSCSSRASTPASTPPPSAATSAALAIASGPHYTAADSLRASSPLLKNHFFSTSGSASPILSIAPLPAPMNSPTTSFAPAADASWRKSGAGIRPSSPLLAFTPTASSRV